MFSLRNKKNIFEFSQYPLLSGALPSDEMLLKLLNTSHMEFSLIMKLVGSIRLVHLVDDEACCTQHVCHATQVSGAFACVVQHVSP